MKEIQNVERELGEGERRRAERKNKENERRGTKETRKIKKEEREKSPKKSLVSMLHCNFLLFSFGCRSQM